MKRCLGYLTLYMCNTILILQYPPHYTQYNMASGIYLVDTVHCVEEKNIHPHKSSFFV